MANIRKWLEEAVAAEGGTLEAVVVGKHDDRYFSDEALPDENIILTVDAALAKLDVDHDSGYGAPDCFPIWAWTKDRVYFIAEYDGATGLAWVPRNPVAGEPSFSGQ